MHATRPEVIGSYEATTSSVQYIRIDPATDRCAVIDPVLNFDANAARTSTESADEILALIRERGLTVDWILDTHPHADHFKAHGGSRSGGGADRRRRCEPR